MDGKRNYKALFFLFVFMLLILPFSAQAEEGKWTAGFRTGFSLLTQESTGNTDAGIGPVVNLQGLYGLKESLAVGFMFEWERHSLDQERPELDIGAWNTFSLMPILEWYIGPYGRVFPYLSAGIGVNVNTFGEDSSFNPNVSLSDNFAFRLAGGADFPLSDQLALNAEVAWKRNRGSITVGNTSSNFDASSMNLLVGVRYTF